MKDRDINLDWIKGFLIVCVVLGHTMRVGSRAGVLDQIVLRGIYGFHMPLFMLLCGYFFKLSSPGEIARKTLKRLVVPYCVGSVLFGGLNILQGRPIVEVITNVACGRGIGALWFLYTVAFIQLIIAVGVCAYRRRASWAIPVMAALFAVGLASPIRCEAWSLFYFGSGMVLARNKELMPKGWIGLIGFGAFMWFGHPWYTELGWKTISLSMCVLMILNSASHILFDKFGGSALSLLGRHTMIILIFHPLFSTIFRVAQKTILSVDGTGVTFFLLSAIFSVVGCLVLEVFLKRIKIGFLFGLK